MTDAEKKPKLEARGKCWERGFHEFREFIDPRSGGFLRCVDCDHEVDCEDPDGEGND